MTVTPEMLLFLAGVLALAGVVLVVIGALAGRIVEVWQALKWEGE
ncbi:MAG: hypothetical protein WA154_11135 [Moraxellaceae bacterium]